MASRDAPSATTWAPFATCRVRPAKSVALPASVWLLRASFAAPLCSLRAPCESSDAPLATWAVPLLTEAVPERSSSAPGGHLVHARGEAVGAVVELGGALGQLRGAVGELAGAARGLLVRLGDLVEPAVDVLQVALRRLVAQRRGGRGDHLLADVGQRRAGRAVAAQGELAAHGLVAAGRHDRGREVRRDGEDGVVPPRAQPRLGVVAVGEGPVELGVRVRRVGERGRQRAARGHGGRFGDDLVAVDDGDGHLVEVLLPVGGRPEEHHRRQQREQQSRYGVPRPASSSATCVRLVLTHQLLLLRSGRAPVLRPPALTPTRRRPASTASPRPRELVGESAGGHLVVGGELVDADQHDHLGVGGDGERRLDAPRRAANRRPRSRARRRGPPPGRRTRVVSGARS